MTIRSILDILDPRLRVASTAVQSVDEPTDQLVRDMLETMAHANGAGLAAIQVGAPLRIFTMKLEGDIPPFALINPAIVRRSTEEIEVEEGCLSMPGLYFPVRRAARITVEFQNGS